MFAYCGNCPTIYVDPSGNAYKDPRREAQYSCIDDGYGSSGGNAGSIGLELIALGAAGLSFIAGAVMATYDVVTTYVSTYINTKAHSLSIGKTQEEKPYQYWEATLNGNSIIIGDGLTFVEASFRVSCGFNILCANQDAAKWILVANRYWNAVGPEVGRGDGFLYHYHPHRNTKVHIWFLGGVDS